ncbi:hypothetical protein [Yersinia ruckeri]|uniref:hypothetical protein n=1 Tax=Yersinia ruckeri TaxID=29486 RepID=UPI001F3ED455|nr:hypothetical protein [Yersinia ruckeri]UIM96972.1 hypothetical protein LGL89_13370 [Yersinia ruckeri]
MEVTGACCSDVLYQIYLKIKEIDDMNENDISSIISMIDDFFMARLANFINLKDLANKIL